MGHSEKKFDLPALLASASRIWISVQSASQCSRQMCKKRAWVRDALFRRDNSATVCSHSFQPLNQSVRIPTWSRNIMACLLSEENRNVWWGGGGGGTKRLLFGARIGSVLHCTVGVYLRQSWDPLRLARGALTWFRCRRKLQTGAPCWLSGRCLMKWYSKSVPIAAGCDTNRKSSFHSGMFRITSSGPYQINKKTRNNFFKTGINHIFIEKKHEFFARPSPSIHPIHWAYVRPVM